MINRGGVQARPDPRAGPRSRAAAALVYVLGSAALLAVAGLALRERQGRDADRVVRANCKGCTLHRQGPRDVRKMFCRLSSASLLLGVAFKEHRVR